MSDVEDVLHDPSLANSTLPDSVPLSSSLFHLTRVPTLAQLMTNDFTLISMHVVRIRLSPLPMAPPLAQKTFKVSRNNKFASVIIFLRKKLGLRREEGVFCYVNSVFAPGLDEGVGGLWDVSQFHPVQSTLLRGSSCRRRPHIHSPALVDITSTNN